MVCPPHIIQSKLEKDKQYKEKSMDVNEIIEQISEASNDDYPQAFKLLGFVVYFAQEGSDSLLSKRMISQRTYLQMAKYYRGCGVG